MTNAPLDPVVPAAASTRSSAMRWPISVAVGALVVAASAQVAFPVPFSPVPMTLQGLAVLLVGGLLGATAGATALVVYLTLGVFGAPVFALGTSGLARLLGPTGGYLLAFPVAALVVGRIGERGQLARCLLGALAGMVVIHLGGWAQLTLLTGGAKQAVTAGVVPFLLQDLLKVALAGLVLWRAQHALRPRA